MKRIKIGQVVKMKETKHLYGKTLYKGQELTRVCTTEHPIGDIYGRPEKGMWFADIKSGEVKSVHKLKTKEITL